MGAEWRDRLNLIIDGTYGDRPAASADLEGVFYFVISGDTNLGKFYRCKSSTWVLIPLHEWLATADHNHDTDYAPTPHNNDHHSETYLTEFVDDDTDRASAVGAAHSVQAKTAALADNATLLDSYTPMQLMLLGAELFGE